MFDLIASEGHVQVFTVWIPPPFVATVSKLRFTKGRGGRTSYHEIEGVGSWIRCYRY